ncbi:MAG: thiaminase II [Cellulosilyticaceae bacterium]
MFTDELLTNSQSIWDSYLNHPFINEIGNGTLPINKFKNYLIQDYLYLIQYAKLFAIGVLKSNTVEDLKRFKNGIDGSLEDETAVHIRYLKTFGITPLDAEQCVSHKTNISYTSYMLSVACTGDLKELMATLLPCIWSYGYIGKYLASTYSENLSTNNYADWINSYNSIEYQQSCEKWIKFMNDLTLHCSPEEKKHLSTIFKRSSAFELDFWDMAYEEEVQSC